MHWEVFIPTVVQAKTQAGQTQAACNFDWSSFSTRPGVHRDLFQRQALAAFAAHQCEFQVQLPSRPPLCFRFPEQLHALSNMNEAFASIAITERVDLPKSRSMSGVLAIELEPLMQCMEDISELHSLWFDADIQSLGEEMNVQRDQDASKIRLRLLKNASVLFGEGFHSLMELCEGEKISVSVLEDAYSQKNLQRLKMVFAHFDSHALSQGNDHAQFELLELSTPSPYSQGTGGKSNKEQAA